MAKTQESFRIPRLFNTAFAAVFRKNGYFDFSNKPPSHVRAVSSVIKCTVFPLSMTMRKRSSNASQTVAVLSFGWTPTRGFPSSDRSNTTSTAASGSLIIPSGVTSPPISPSYLCRRSADAKLSLVEPSCVSIDLRSARQFPGITTKK